jgi:phosphomevalonate kinase
MVDLMLNPCVFFVGCSDRDEHAATIIVRAGQFPAESSTWRYLVTLLATSPPTLSLEPADQSSGRNKFVEVTLSRTLELAWAMLAQIFSGEDAAVLGARELLSRIRGDGDSLTLVMLADNDFYSQREQVRPSQLESAYFILIGT